MNIQAESSVGNSRHRGRHLNWIPVGLKFLTRTGLTQELSRLQVVVVVVFISAYNENNSIINEQQSHCMPGLPEGHASPTSWPPVLRILCQLAVQRNEN